jgi:hypothetical protein
VIKDLDITRFMTEVEVPSSMSRLASLTNLNADPLPPMPAMQESEEASEAASEAAYKPTLSPRKRTEDKLSPADAVQHMQNVSQLLRTWRNGLERPD